jgi:DNA-binding GntR family transcriptional regulator
MSRLDVGRTPVREALQRLQRDGFVVIIARRGTFVSKIDISDLTAIYEARARIESWATRLAAERLREPERREARELIDALRAITGPSELDALLALDRRIHRFIYRSAKNPYLFDTLDHYQNLSLRPAPIAAIPGLRRVDVEVFRHDVVIASRYDEGAGRAEIARVGRQAIRPSQLVIEFGAGATVSIRSVSPAPNRLMDNSVLRLFGEG